MTDAKLPYQGGDQTVKIFELIGKS
jgi:hypothetical protein